jgi:hypothetical protein
MMRYNNCEAEKASDRSNQGRTYGMDMKNVGSRHGGEKDAEARVNEGF